MTHVYRANIHTPFFQFAGLPFVSALYEVFHILVVGIAVNCERHTLSSFSVINKLMHNELMRLIKCAGGK